MNIENLFTVSGEKTTFAMREFKGSPHAILQIIAALISLFMLLTGYFGELDIFVQRPILLGSCLFIIFLTHPANQKCSSPMWLIADVALAFLSLLPCLYLAWNWEEVNIRNFVALPFEYALGILMLVLVLEATRRTAGIALCVIGVLLIIYGMYGEVMPGMLAHKNLSFHRVIESLFLGHEGIWGIPLGVMSSFIFVFIIFATILNITGIGDFFTDFANSLFGIFRGGPAKISVVGSGLFATLSGSSTSNVAATGTFTIPLMKKTGFPPHIAGAIESVSSIGGQFAPPVMGASAFVMAELLQIPYLKICVAALLPAVTYYVCVFTTIDSEAAKLGMKGRDRSDLPRIKEVLWSRGYLVLPVFVFVYFLAVVQMSPSKSAIWGIITALLFSSIRPATRLTMKKFYEGLAKACSSALSIVAVTACAGITINMVMVTGLGVNFSAFLIDVAGGNLLILLILTMLSSLIMGMGLPTVACYIILAILVAPALTGIGVPEISAHLFILYYGVMANITPPMMFDIWIASSIAGSEPMKTGWTAVRLAIAAFLLPYFWVYNSGILLGGSLAFGLVGFIRAVIGIMAIALSMSGYLHGRMKIYESAIMFLGAILLLFPGAISDVVGIVTICVVVLIRIKSKRSSMST